MTSAPDPDGDDGIFLRWLSENWTRIPLKLRRRWWDETDFGSNPPNQELKKAVIDALSPGGSAPS